MKKKIIIVLVFLLVLINFGSVIWYNQMPKSPFEIQEPYTLGNIGSKNNDTFEFVRSDLKIEDGQRTIGLFLPIDFNKEVVGITQNLDCTITKNGENYLIDFSKVKETEKGSTAINEEFDLMVDMLFGSNDEKVILNTGSSTGVRQEGIKILKAPRKSTAGVYYYFTNNLNSDLSMSCTSNILSEKPIFASSKKFRIEYSK